jgi:hypothetical protein
VKPHEGTKRLGMAVMLLVGSALLVAAGALAAMAIPKGKPAFPLQQLKAVASRTADSLGDPSLRTALVFDTTRRAALDVVSVGEDPAHDPSANSSATVFLIVLHGRFVCPMCSVPPGGKQPSGTIATVVWSSIRGTTDFSLSRHLPTQLSRLGRATTIRIGH